MLQLEQLSEQKVGDIVTQNYHAAGVFREHGIDFCCGGGISVQEACEKKGIEPEKVTLQLRQLAESAPSGGDNYSEWSPDFLIDYIENTHHRFVRTKVHEIGAYAQKVAQVHGERHPWNITIFHTYVDLARELLDHLEAEEKTVFPLIKQVAELRDNDKPIDPEITTSLRSELEKMESDHDGAGEAIAKIRELSSDFTPPADACTTYQVLYQNLAGFEEDLHKHVHLENNILFRKAEALLDGTER